MELLGDVGHVESHFFLFGDSVCVGARLVHSLRQTYHRLRNYFGRTWWYSYVTRLKWKLVSVGLDIVLILMQDRYTVCVECTIGTDIVLYTLDETPGWRGHENLTSFRSEIVLLSVQDSCMICARHTIGSKIILDAPDGTTRWWGSSGRSFWSFRIKC
jgi:hypothetical protein